MKKHVFTLSPFPEGERWSLRAPELVHQIVRVLKLRTGEEVVFVDGAGGRVEAEIVGYTDRAIDVRLQHVAAPEPATAHVADAERSIVCFALLKKDHTEWLIQKLAELGVTDAIPLVTARTIKKDVRLDRLEAIAREAMEQSEQARLMRVHPLTDIAGAMRTLQRWGMSIAVCDTGAGLPSLAKRQEGGERVQALFVGPEGGWSDEERASFEQDYACKRVSLGKTILRGETAGMLAGYELIRDRTP